MRFPAIVGCAALALAACGSQETSETDATPGDSHRVTVQNCGREVTVEEPPQRIVSLNQGSTEILLSLGLADRMVGTATWTDPVLGSLSEENEKVERLADNAPSFEAVLDAEPDFVTASFGSILDEGGVASRDEFADLGVNTYLSPADCEGKVDNAGDGARETPFDIDLVYREIRELAHIFGVPGEGERLVASLEDRFAAATDLVDAEGVTALFWFANSESPYMAGCCGAPGLIAQSLGLTNVFADTTDEWPQINWEIVADRNPDVLILGDLTRKSQTAETGEAKIDFLESHPLTREMDAVQNERYIVVTGAEMNPSLRTIHGVENVARGLRELGLDD